MSHHHHWEYDHPLRLHRCECGAWVTSQRLVHTGVSSWDSASLDLLAIGLIPA